MFPSAFLWRWETLVCMWACCHPRCSGGCSCHPPPPCPWSSEPGRRTVQPAKKIFMNNQRSSLLLRWNIGTLTLNIYLGKIWFFTPSHPIRIVDMKAVPEFKWKMHNLLYQRSEKDIKAFTQLDEPWCSAVQVWAMWLSWVVIISIYYQPNQFVHRVINILVLINFC